MLVGGPISRLVRHGTVGASEQFGRDRLGARLGQAFASERDVYLIQVDEFDGCLLDGRSKIAVVVGSHTSRCRGGVQVRNG